MNQEIDIKVNGIIRVCVPEGWGDAHVIEYVNCMIRPDVPGGWVICNTGDERLKGSKKRVACNHRNDHVHMVLYDKSYGIKNE